MRIDHAKKTGICKGCGFHKDRCRWHDLQSLNYRNIKMGDCALNESEVKAIINDYQLKVKV
ncbi:unnamed protein product [marine sediment metagenome]|uniref:Uncharacterized protein n=1 Tax=marine sediment metagenome TaxID=412755 RepID=X1AE26_9ZZZZ